MLLERNLALERHSHRNGDFITAGKLLSLHLHAIFIGMVAIAPIQFL
jgi:hypothetical protein